MKIKYLPVFTNDIEKQVSFFTDCLGFEIYGKKPIFSGQESILIKTHSADVFIAIIKDTANEYRRGHIVLNCDDCLNDYHKLKMAGVIFCNEPQYLPIGMGIEFIDPFGNRYLLIEERSYNSPIW